MGVLQECVISRRDGTAKFKGHAWVGSGGFFDAVWTENGKTERASFQVNGQPIGVWNPYRIALV